jgi:general secretion pathway protein E
VRRVHAQCRGEGCHTCFGSGFKGRVGLFELLTVDEKTRERIAENATATGIRMAARDSGMRSLMQEGERLAASGLSTRAEVERVVWGLE